VAPEQSSVFVPPVTDDGPAWSSCELRMHVAEPREMQFPAHVAHGDGLLSSAGELLSRWGTATGSALVVSDRFLADSGVVDPLLASLSRSGWRVEVCAAPGGEPALADAAEVVEAARRSRADLVIGFGGGSVMDLAKVAALLLSNPGDVAQQAGTADGVEPAKPLILIPTTAGTGAEATRVAVLRGDGHRKQVLSHPSLVPLGVILDPAVLRDLPRHITAATGMDALAHAVESSLSTGSSPLTASMGLRAASLLLHWLPVAYRDPGDPRARRGTLYGAFLAGLALNAGVVLGHSMAYTVANRTELAHGVTCAMALPYCVAFNAPGVQEDLSAWARLLTGGASGDLGAAAESLAALAASFDIPATPAAAGIAASESAVMAHECADVYPRPTNPVAMTHRRLEALYAAWFLGDIRAAATSGEIAS
jgi:alcohol dehydrogenase class IV